MDIKAYIYVGSDNSVRLTVVYPNEITSLGSYIITCVGEIIIG